MSEHTADKDAPRWGALVDPQRFCGQQQSHWPHRWVTPECMYAACSGKSCSCVFPPEAGKP